MKARFITHAAKAVSVFFGIEIELSDDGSGVRYRRANYAPSTPGIEYSRVSRWQQVKYECDRPYFICNGSREYLDEYTKVDKTSSFTH